MKPLNILKTRFINIKSFVFYALLIFGSCLIACVDQTKNPKEPEVGGEQLTIFFINDQHGQLENFAKVKTIVDGARDSLNVLLVCAGDLFSGNPIVDQHDQKGFPMIDIMNNTGFDVSVIGNHEFDYGQEILAERMSQAEFQWVCANLNVNQTNLPQPDPYISIEIDDLKVTFLGLVETDGKPDAVIPSTHPWRVLGLTFERFGDVIGKYSELKSQETSDLLVALTHLGSYSDRNLAANFPELDLIIGGHSHEVINEESNGIPIVQSGSYLHKLGQIDLTIKDQEILDYEVTFIELDNYNATDETLFELIETYNDNPDFEEVVGFSESDLTRSEAGCFYTTALKDYLQTDCSFQNGGGVRAGIDQGDITTMEIYNMDPFNNKSVIFTFTVAEIKDFLQETGAGLHVSGITIENQQNQLIIYDESGNELEDTETITIAINDYIPAVYDSYFPLDRAAIQEITTAEAVIGYLKTINSTIDFENCDRYFEYE